MKVTSGQNVMPLRRLCLTGQFDNSRVRGQTLDFQLGSGQLLTGFNDAIVGMSVGETRTVNLTADEAYGQPVDEAIQRVPRTAFADDFVFEQGATVQGNGPAGPFIAKIQEVQDDTPLILTILSPERT